ncbi:unnamed protein product [Fusarium fujikuroi]|nr:unnamed protein product [Fusarium fujikuroi]
MPLLKPISIILLLPAKVFLLYTQSKGIALAIYSNWLFNFTISILALDAFNGIRGYYYLIIAGFCLISVGIAYFYYVETAGHTLEEIALAFGDKAFVDNDGAVIGAAHLRRDDAIKTVMA